MILSNHLILIWPYICYNTHNITSTQEFILQQKVCSCALLDFTHVATIAHHPEAAGLIKLEGPNAGSIVVPAGAISWRYPVRLGCCPTECFCYQWCFCFPNGLIVHGEHLTSQVWVTCSASVVPTMAPALSGLWSHYFLPLPLQISSGEDFLLCSSLSLSFAGCPPLTTVL